MKKEEAERLVVAELRRRIRGIDPKDFNPMTGLALFHQVERERPELLEFRCSGDKWQVVSGWINKHDLLARRL